MRCDELMKRNPECVKDGASVAEVAALMRDRNIGFVPVCNDRGEVIGTVTDRDLCVRVLAAQADPVKTTVRNVMTNEIVAVRPDDDLNKAEQLMGDYKKSRVLVTDNHSHPVGVISLSDIAASGRRNAAQVLSAIAQREAAA